MQKKWMAKLSAPLLALALLSACGSTNNDDENIPKDTNIPDNNEPNQEDIRYNNDNFEAPDNEKLRNNNRNVPNNDEMRDNDRKAPNKKSHVNPNEAPENGFYDLPNRNG